MAKLSAYVYVQRNGEIVGLGPGDEVPADLAGMIGAHAFEGGEHPGSAASGPPPKGGPGSGAEAWAQYAADQGVSVAEGASRDEIVEALSKAGKPVDPQ